MSSEPQGQPEIPAQIFAQFLSGLEKAAIPADLIERLRATILGQQDLSEKALRAAMFPEDESND